MTQTKVQPIDLPEHLARIDRELAENARWRAQTRAVKQHSIPPWLFVVGIVLAVALVSPMMIAVLDRIWPT